ncbi:MAG: DUF6569 family protein [Bacteroidota bacterium]
MKKAFIPWLAAGLAVVISVFVLFHFTARPTYFFSASLPKSSDTISRPGALFDDPIQTTGFEIPATSKYKHLQVFILAGNVTADNRRYVTLQMALETKMVTVRETGEVNELQIDNHSGEYIYINSGDIVKGGKQDRTIQYDVIIPPHKMAINIASFCVEHGRWTQRQNEAVGNFEKSESSLSSKELKIAAKHAKSQEKVWEKVSKYQDKANYEYNKAAPSDRPVDVKSAVSSSSLQLTLDNETIKQSKEDYRKQFAALKNTKRGAGLAYYINGKLYGVDLFNNHQLFTDLFDKLLDAAITEAISESIASSDKKLLTNLDHLLLANAKVYEDLDVNEITRFQSSETPNYKDLVIFTTIDKTVKTWLHRNWLDKTED